MYIPSRFNSRKGKWEPIHRKRELKNASPNYPGWICKNSCGREFPEGSHYKKCPDCEAPLVRWMGYEQK